MHNFILVNCDTDSITFCKNDGTIFSENEQYNLLLELNSLYPGSINWEHDGIFNKLIVLKAKNYIMFDGTKIKLKGSSLKDQKKEPALKEMLDTMIKDLIDTNGDNCHNIYLTYIKEALLPIDIRRWSTKKTVTKAILNCATDPEARLNERKVYDAIAHRPVQEGDKVYLYPCIKSIDIQERILKNGKVRQKITKETGLKLADEWQKDHDTEKLVERVYSTVEILGGVIDMGRFTDYTLVKNKELLDNLG